MEMMTAEKLARLNWDDVNTVRKNRGLFNEKRRKEILNGCASASRARAAEAQALPIDGDLHQGMVEWAVNLAIVVRVEVLHVEACNNSHRRDNEEVWNELKFLIDGQWRPPGGGPPWYKSPAAAHEIWRTRVAALVRALGYDGI
jgi:hypothetical protein